MPIDQTKVRAHLATLLGRNVVLKPGKAGSLPPAPSFTALYVDDHKELRGAWVADIPFAAAAGAALTLTPAGVAKECVTKKSLVEPINDNYREVVNVLSVVLSEALGCGIRLTDYYESAKTPADAAKTLAAKSPKGQRLDVVVAVEGYGEGTISVLAW